MKIAIVQLSGGLGNQIFQFTFGQYLIKSGFKVYYDKHSGFRKSKNKNKLDKLNLDILYSNKLISLILFGLYKLNFKLIYFKEKETFCFDNSIKNHQRMISFFIGCWQNLKYVEHIKKDLKNKIFINNNLLRDTSRKFVFDSNSVAIHVRRGDYINNKLHQITDENYFKNAVNIFHEKLKNPTFYIFSDDLLWCKNFFKESNFIFMESNKSEIHDFYLMQKCKHKIISNSTFSWWPSYLSDSNSMIICPSKWINGDQSSNSLQLSTWIKI